jgi:hypothetical protein
MSNEKKITKLSNLQNMFCFSPFFGPLLLSNLITFLLLIHLKQFKLLHECHLTFYKSSLNSNNIRTTYKEFCGCLGTNLCSIWWFVFYEFLTPFILRGHNLLLFWTIFSALDEPIKGLQKKFRCKKQWSLPLGYNLLRLLKCYKCNSIATSEQSKDLTHMFCL